MNTELLKKKILQLAMQGKLVEQDESDGTADELIDKIIEEKKQLMDEGKIKKEKLSRIYKNPTDNHYYEKFEDGREKDITAEIPYEIPSNWCWTRLGALEEINLGFTYRPEYTNDGVYFLSVKDISGGKIDFSESKKVSKKTFDNASYGSKPKKGDILFGRVGTIGKPQIISEDIPFCIFVSLGFLRDHLNILNKEYICSWMNSYLFEEQVKLKVKGTAQINLNTGWLKNFYIPLPPIDEQNKITLKIEELEKNIELIEKSKKKIEKLKELLKSKIIDMAIKGELTKQLPTDEPASKLIKNILEEKRKLMEEGKIKKENLSVIYKDSTDNQFYEKFDNGKIINITKEIPFNVPTNWSWTRLRNLGELLSGYAYKSSMYVKKTNNLVIRLGNVKNDKIIYNAHPVYINNTLANETQKYLIEENDILITMTGTRHKRDYFYTKLIDKKDIINYNLYLNQRVGNFKCNLNMNLDYLIKIFKSKIILDQVFSKETGTANQGNIGVDAILNILVPIPPINEQNKISKILIMTNNTIKNS